jgi:hypothetical protein
MASPGGFALGSPSYGSQQDPHPAPYSPGGGQAITAGAVTYTTSTGPDGRGECAIRTCHSDLGIDLATVIYHPFRSVKDSERLPEMNGVIDE